LPPRESSNCRWERKRLACFRIRHGNTVGAIRTVDAARRDGDVAVALAALDRRLQGLLAGDRDAGDELGQGGARSGGGAGPGLA
jgi:hypothetical protein